MQLTPYQQEKFKNFERDVKDGVWYAIKADRPDREEFILALRLFIDVYSNLEFNRDYTAFRRSYAPLCQLWLSERDKTVTHQLVKEYHDQIQQELDEKYPPKPKYQRR